MAKLTNEELVNLVRYEIEQSQGYDTDVLSAKREKALQYYHGIMVPGKEGCSSVVSKDVADTVHALLAEIEPIYRTTIIKFKPGAEDDEAQAQLESDYTRYKFEESGGEKILYNAAHDALLISNGWIKVDVQENVEITTHQYGELDEWQLEAALEPTAENQTTDAQSDGSSVTITRKTTTHEMVIEALAPEKMIFSNGVGQGVLEKLRLVGERVMYSVSDLIEMGVSQDDAASIPDAEVDYWPAFRAREGIYNNTSQDDQSAQGAERLKECFDVHFRVDANNNGTSELRRIIIGGSVLIKDEPAECLPYATGSPIPMPHRVQGTGMFEIMGEIQDQKTDTLRKFIDNLDVLNKSRVWAVEGEVNMSDLTAARNNGVVRIAAPGMVGDMPGADAGPQCIAGLNYMDSVRSQRGGGSVEHNDADKQVMASSAMAASGMQKTSERTAGWYARNLINTLLKDTFALIHKRLRLDMPGTVTANLRGKWVETDPATWPERKHIETLAGLTSTERANKIQGLTVVIQSLKGMMQEGGEGIITDKSKLYGAMSDWINAAEIGTPDEYLIDPDSDEAKQAQQAQQQQAQQQQQTIQQQHNQMVELQRQIEANKTEYDYYKTSAELKFKYYDAQLDADVKETEMTLALVESNENIQQD